MAAAKRRKKTKGASKSSNNDVLLEEVRTIKQLLMLQLVTGGVKAVDIAETLKVDKSVISGLVPVRRLAIKKGQVSEETEAVTKRLDTLIALSRKKNR